jgi:hypothetical protein
MMENVCMNQYRILTPYEETGFGVWSSMITPDPFQPSMTVGSTGKAPG